MTSTEAVSQHYSRRGIGDFTVNFQTNWFKVWMRKISSVRCRLEGGGGWLEDSTRTDGRQTGRFSLYSH